MWRPELPIVTERLSLRAFSMADLDELWAFMRLPEVTRHMLWSARDEDQAREALTRMVGESGLEKDGDYLTLAAVLDGTVIGYVELGLRSAWHEQGEIGYVFHPAYQGKGYATECAREMLRLGFAEMDLHRIVAHCSAKNTASANLMRRLGMRQEAHLVESRKVPGGWREELIFAILRREWSGQDR